jgi:hypothetical protein
MELEEFVEKRLYAKAAGYFGFDMAPRSVKKTKMIRRRHACIFIYEVEFLVANCRVTKKVFDKIFFQNVFDYYGGANNYLGLVREITDYLYQSGASFLWKIYDATDVPSVLIGEYVKGKNAEEDIFKWGGVAPKRRKAEFVFTKSVDFIAALHQYRLDERYHPQAFFGAAVYANDLLDDEKESGLAFLGGELRKKVCVYLELLKNGVKWEERAGTLLSDHQLKNLIVTEDERLMPVDLNFCTGPLSQSFSQLALQLKAHMLFCPGTYLYGEMNKYMQMLTRIFMERCGEQSPPEEMRFYLIKATLAQIKHYVKKSNILFRLIMEKDIKDLLNGQYCGLELGCGKYNTGEGMR